MKYYVTSDTHGFYSLLRYTLEKVGFFKEEEDHRLVILGDLFDRGGEAIEMQDFILHLMDEQKAILIRGNHEDLYKELVTEDFGYPYEHHITNGTFRTALDLTGVELKDAIHDHIKFARAGRNTPFYQRIIPSMLDYYETKNYIFTHGWIPCIANRHTGYSYYADWRDVDSFEWQRARWINGIDAAQTCMEDKTIFCGHWHASYGHWKYEHKGSEFGDDADYSPYYGPGIIAIDACTAWSNQINVVVIEDEPLDAT